MEPAEASHRFQAWAEVGQETGQLHGGKRRGRVTQPLCNAVSPCHTGPSSRQCEAEAKEIRPLPPGLANQRHSMHSSSLEPMPGRNSNGYGCSWYDGDGGAERQDGVTLPQANRQVKGCSTEPREERQTEDSSMASIASPHTLSMTPSNAQHILTHLKLPEGLWG